MISLPTYFLGNEGVCDAILVPETRKIKFDGELKITIRYLQLCKSVGSYVDFLGCRWHLKWVAQYWKQTMEYVT